MCVSVSVMEEECCSSNPLLLKYRNDRRKLIEFLLSSSSSTTVSTIDFDSLSIDYLLQCIQSGGVMDAFQARERYSQDSSHPIMIPSQSGDAAFYLLSHPDSAGSPPHRMPPPITINHRGFVESDNSGWSNPFVAQPSDLFSKETAASHTNPLHNADILSLGLPPLKTGLLDDDLRESAYEVFLACMLFSGVEIQPADSRKREKSPRFLVGLKNRRDKRHLESESPARHFKVLDSTRIQMQISEGTDTFVKRRLTQFAATRPCTQIDIPQLSLVLLTGILRSDFSSEKSYFHWKNRQANVLEELVSCDHKKIEKQMMGSSLEKIRNPEEWDVKMSPAERSDVLLTIRQVALAFSSMPGRFGMKGETYYWTTSYHLNIRLYEKLLFSVFDILEDGQLIEEAEGILKLVKLTWPTLGITQRLHDTLFAWVLFQQFVATKEAELLDYAICQVKKVQSSGVCDDNEAAYLKSLMCSAIGNESEILNLSQFVFLSISLWGDRKLQDYHLYFNQNPSLFERVVMLVLSTITQDFVPHESIQLSGPSFPSEEVTKKIRIYVENSLSTACYRVTDRITIESINDKIHPLAFLASELRLIAEKDLCVFNPVLRRWHLECAMISTKTLHQFYGGRLKPYLKNVGDLGDDARKVLSAAYTFEQCLIELHSSAVKENNSKFVLELEHYPIAEISRSIILDWVVAQHERILEWTGRAFDLEEWEPLSVQQKQSASAVEVFRIIEETVDQFFEWSVPMDITHLQALLSIIFHSLDAYLSKLVSQLVDKQKLYPSAPPLTRYKEATIPMVKKKVVERLILDDELYSQLDEMTSSKLCVILNTYRYIQKQTGVLEEGIRNSWEATTSRRIRGCSTVQTLKTLDTTVDPDGESVSELFVATLDCIRDSAAQAIRKTSDFLGAKIVFWDLRDSFLLHLYHGGVEANRIDGVLPKFDGVLNSVCGLIDVAIRDLVVSSIWKASLEGLMWVLLDGGPSRSFSDIDTTMIEEDLGMLKDLFVADGEGLPRSLVEEEAKSAHRILNLFSFQTETLIQMLMASSKQISVGPSNSTFGQRYVGDAQTLIRILCHKKDRKASNFLKKHYKLPSSSEYDEIAPEDSSFSSPLVADIWKKSASFRWPDKGSSSFRSIKKKFATWDIKNVAW